jgi:cell division protein FtsW (lipid II flippase)
MTDCRESRLLILAFVYLFIYSVVLSLAPSVRNHSWSVSYPISHWIGFLLWTVAVFITYRIISRKLVEHDPYLLPLASLLSGWGLLTIWRLEPDLGFRQVLWLIVSFAAFIGMLYVPSDLYFLRRYKYILLSMSLLLTGLTLLLGTNPLGIGPRRWLGSAGIYLQPSEPLKLLLIVYLAAYLADRLPIRLRIFPLILPTLFVTGFAILLLIIQRDLGTASIIILLYTVILYIATDKGRVLIVTSGALLLAGLIGFFFIDIIHARLDEWINPWNDPSGQSYQIIQSLLAVANGGLVGRGPGLGSPTLVPVAYSDFIFTSIAEETGLIGTFGLFCIYGLILGRGLIAAINATDNFHRLLATGLTAYIGVQALIIIGGNIRLFPLTGVTLPFVSYGGSSLLTSFIALSLLLIISNKIDKEPTAILSVRPYYLLAALLGFGLIGVSLVNSWWSVIRSPDLLNRTDNPRRSISDRYVLRGQLMDRNNQPIDITQGTSGSYQRVYMYTPLAPISGYTHPVYGQAGLEASLDDYLRGLQGNPASLIWWDQLVYGTPPPGLNVRLSLDLELQEQADSLLGNITGAVVLLNARTGEILILASHPYYDPNKLDEIGSSLARDKNSPLIDRAAQGMYPLGTAIYPFLNISTSEYGLRDENLKNLYIKLGFYSTPLIRLPVGIADDGKEINNIRVSPLQMAVALATLSNNGIRPAPRIALAVNTPQQGWIVLPALGVTNEIFTPETTNKLALKLADPNHTFWDWTGIAQANQESITWYLAGTLPNWQGTPLSLVIVTEGSNQLRAQTIGRQLIQASMNH